MEIIDNKTMKALSPTGIELADYVINPYKGCEIGCTYCYSRSNKGAAKIQKNWGEYVFIKKNLPDLLAAELDSLNGGITGRILLGSTTEVFQPAEENHHITEKILEILKSRQIPVTILSKSCLLVKYIELLKYSGENIVYFTYNSEKVRMLFEKKSCPQSVRLETINSIYRNSIRLIVYISPVFPFITDIEEIFRNLAGKTEKIYFEAFNIKMGNWTDIKKILECEYSGSGEMIKKYEKIFFYENEYDSFWNRFISEANRLNSKYGYKLKFFIQPFDSYYKGKNS